MTDLPRRICLVAPGHVASTPRMVKAADALHEAGCEVFVLASDHYAPVRPLDAALLKNARWTCRGLPNRGSAAMLLARIARAAALRLSRRGRPSAATAARALSPNIGYFVPAALEIKADLFIGHTLAGLAIAGEAARRSRARLGFDAEDWHREELDETAMPPGEKEARIALEEYWIPRCDFVTAASPLIADAYAPLRGGEKPTVVLNVFPLNEAPARGPGPDPRPTTLYWFSQTIGPGRGLEAVVAALAHLPSDWQLHLRGQPATGYQDALAALASQHRVSGRIHWLPSAPPTEMVRLAAGYGVGLAVELNEPANRARCLTNKIFTYLLAGTPVLLSDTAAQRLLAPELGAAAALVSLDDPAALASAIIRLATPEAAGHAWYLGQTRYHWQQESGRLLDAVRTGTSRIQNTTTPAAQ